MMLEPPETHSSELQTHPFHAQTAVTAEIHGISYNCD